MSAVVGRRLLPLALVFVAAALTACGGGSKMLKEPLEVELQQPLASAADENLSATLDWVIVKDGPGTWSKNAWWDEYLLQVVNRSGHDLTISSVQVIDSLGTPLATGSDRKQLVRASKATTRRYKDYDVRVKPGAGTGTLVAVGTGAFVVAGAAAMVSVGAGIGSAFSLGATTASTPAIVTAAGTVAIVAAPVLIVGGVVKGANNSKVSKEIINRQTDLPLQVAAGDTHSLNVFFPVAPSPRAVQLVYETEAGGRVIEIVTADVLHGLHLQSPEDDDAAVAEVSRDE